MLVLALQRKTHAPNYIFKTPGSFSKSPRQNNGLSVIELRQQTKIADVML